MGNVLHDYGDSRQSFSEKTLAVKAMMCRSMACHISRFVNKTSLTLETPFLSLLDKASWQALNMDIDYCTIAVSVKAQGLN